MSLHPHCQPMQSSALLIILHCFTITAPLRPRSCAYSVVPPPLDSEEKQMLDRFLRVDHAGEYGANRIYAGQMAVLGRSRTGPLIQVLVQPQFTWT